jgi:hypothetical protein
MTVSVTVLARCGSQYQLDDFLLVLSNKRFKIPGVRVATVCVATVCVATVCVATVCVATARVATARVYTDH